MSRRNQFICRCCERPGRPAFARAHACVKCWAKWERRIALPPGVPRIGAGGAGVGDSLPPTSVPAPAIRSLSGFCASGGYVCVQCDLFAEVTNGPSGGLMCARCGSLDVVWCPPVAGFNGKLEVSHD
jgi:hypothetical protein